jgi:hypothetical protein
MWTVIEEIYVYLHFGLVSGERQHLGSNSLCLKYLKLHHGHEFSVII